MNESIQICCECDGIACLKENHESTDFYCIKHFNLKFCASGCSQTEIICDDATLEQETNNFHNTCKDAIADLAVMMYTVQRKEENDNRLKRVRLQHKAPVVSDSGQKVVKSSLWRTDISKVDKEELLKSIEETEAAASASQAVGIKCSNCSSTHTIERNRHAVESGKNDIWGNKDSEGGASSIECLDCGYIGAL